MEIEPSMLEIIDGLPETLTAFLERPGSLRPAVMWKFLERVEAIRADDPGTALRLGKAGYEHAATIPRFGDRRERRRVIAQAYAVYGGAARTLADFDCAEVAYTVAWEILRPVARPVDRIELLGRVAFLRRDQRRFDEAREAAEEGVRIARAEGDRFWLPRALVHCGIVIAVEKPRASVPFFREALSFLPGKADPDYEFAATQGIALALCNLDDADPAELLRWIDRAVAIAADEPPQSGKGVHVRWLQGVAYRKVGRTAEAEQIFRTVRKVLLELNLPTYAGAAAMELALLYYQQGQSAKTIELAQELFPLFRAIRIDREATAALDLYVSAALSGQLNADLIRQVKQTLSRPLKGERG